MDIVTVGRRRRQVFAGAGLAAALALAYTCEKRARKSWREQQAKKGKNDVQPWCALFDQLKMVDVIRYLVNFTRDLANHERLRANKKDYVKRVLSLVWPSMDLGKLFDFSTPGKAQILSICAATLVRTWLLNRSSQLQKSLTRAAYKRDTTSFKALMGNAAMITAVGSACNAFYSYNKEMLVVLWREKITRSLHDAYFKNMAYYHIANGPGKTMADPDERISRELMSVSRRLVNLVVLLLDSLPAVTWFSLRLLREKGVAYSLFPHLYLLAAYEGAQRLFPKNIGLLHKNVAARQSQYFNGASRVQTHSEAIAALGGAQVEAGILSRLYGAVYSAQQELQNTQSKFNLIFKTAYSCKALVWSFAMLPVVGAPAGAPGLASAEMAEASQMLEMLVSALVANGQLLTLHASAQHMVGVCKRLCDLQDMLGAIGAQASAARSNTMVEGDRIAFDGVQVYTPGGHHLVKDLSFEVNRGEALLITGHNGAGKSSIFRCLGGLWAVPDGVITKPGAREQGLHSDIFYLPQKPYNVLGTLPEQITYPLSPQEAHLSEAEMEEILCKVDLGHLLEEGAGAVVNWEERLSLGEQQRLAMARLFFHRPSIAILDECTSAVSADMETLLYQECAAMNIGYITICHRPALEAFHDTNLHLTGDGAGGWRLHSLANGRSSRPAAPGGPAPPGPPRERLSTEEDTARQLAARSATYQGAGEKKKKTLRRSSMRDKLQLLTEVLLPGNGRVMGLLLGGILVNTAMQEAQTAIVGHMFASVVDRRLELFAGWSILHVLQDLCMPWVEEAVAHLQNRLTLAWNKQLTAHASAKFFGANAFYSMKSLDKRIPDCDRRLTEEISELTSSLSAVWAQAVQPLADIAWFSWRIHGLLQTRDLVSLFGYVASCAVVSQVAMPNHAALQSREKELESRFRFVHTRVRTHAESIAFFGGGEREAAIADKALSEVVAHASKVKASNAWYSFVYHLVSKEESGYRFTSASDVLTAFLQLRYVEEVAAAGGDAAQVAARGHYVAMSTQKTIAAYAKVIDLYETLSSLAGASTRVCDMLQVLDELVPGGPAEGAAPGGRLEGAGARSSIVFEGVDIVTPDGQCLAGDVDLSVQPGSSLLVTGPNAVGKTSFFRVLAGLWPAQRGRVVGVQPSDVFLVPQKVYSVAGSLADQVMYPRCVKAGERDAATEARLLEVLQKVGIAYLVDREGGWDTVRRWEDMLSLGEQQRLGIARLLYCAPAFGVLDECSDAVSADVEERLYAVLHEAGVTCITISKRLALTAFHDWELRLGAANDKGWELQEVA